MGKESVGGRLCVFYKDGHLCFSITFGQERDMYTACSVGRLMQCGIGRYVAKTNMLDRNVGWNHCVGKGTHYLASVVS